jgi:hypothetical protein
MTWQESLRQLDARLAQGEISANEYRKSRDEILAEASSGSAPQPLEDLWASATPKVAEETDAAPGETTIVVEMPKTEEDEPTQVVPAAAIPAQPQWTSTPMPDAPAPPQDVRPMPQRVAPVQEQDVFAVVPSKRGSGLVRFLVPVLILAVVGAGVWWFVSRGDDGNAAAEPTPTSTATEKAPTSDEVAGKLPQLPGTASDNDGTLSVDRAQELKLFSPTYAKLIADNGAKEIVYRGSVRPGFAYMVVASPSADATKLVDATSDHLRQAGFAEDKTVAQDGPPVITRTDPVFRTYIAIYRAGDVWVQLNVSGPPNGDEKALRAEFENVLGSLTERLPAD